MRCPVCGSDIPDGSLVCPYCDSELSVTRTRMRPLNRWCPLCGALVSDDMESCPSCGAPLERPSAEGQAPAGGSGAGADAQAEPGEANAQAQDGSAPGEPETDAAGCPEEPQEPEDLGPHMDTAIPAPGEGPTSRVPAQVRTRALVLAMVAALAVMGGGILYITHPWDPGSNRSNKETIVVDTSTAGSPGTISSISSQDGDSGTARLGTPGSRTTYEWESDAYVMILAAAEQLSANQELLQQVGAGEVTSGFDEGADACASLERQLDALSSDLASATVEDAYVDDVETLVRLVGWLRSWASALDDGWDGVTSATADERAAAVEAALSEAGVTEARVNYEQAVEAAQPQDRG